MRGTERETRSPTLRPRALSERFRGEGFSRKQAILTWPDVGRDARDTAARQRAAAEVAALTSRRAGTSASAFNPLTH